MPLNISDKTHDLLAKYKNFEELRVAKAEIAKHMETSNQNRVKLTALEDELDALDRAEEEATESAAVEGAASGKIDTSGIAKVKTTKLQREAEHAVLDKIQRKLNERLPELKKQEAEIRRAKNSELQFVLMSFLDDNGISKMSNAEVPFDKIKHLTLAEIAVLAKAFSICHFGQTWSDLLQLKMSDFSDYHGHTGNAARNDLKELLGV